MAVDDIYAPYQAAAEQKSQQASATSSPAFLGAAKTVYGDLNSGNYSDAWSTALGTSGMFGTNYDATTTDPLLEVMESGKGLQQFDPGKTWDASSIQQYYNAFGANSVAQGTQAGTALAGDSLGKNPYGQWGDPGKFTSDAQANISTQGDNSAPDVMRFAGAKPTQSFMGKYGADIAALALTAVTFGVAAPALAGALAADGAMSTLAAGAIAGGAAGAASTLGTDAITGKPITWGGVLSGTLGGAAGGGLQGLASGAINDATGLGTTVSGGLAGAGIGAARSALTGGNIGLGALSGGIGGAVQGSGIAGNIKSGLTSAGLSSGLAGALVNGGTNYAIGGVMGAAAGATLGGGGGTMQTAVPRSAAGGATAAAPATATGGSNYLGAAAGAIGAGAGALLGVGGQGNNGNMADPSSSTDSTLASTITGALPGLLQGGAGVYGAQNAAEKQTQADQQAIGTQQSTLGNINSIWSTQQQTGQGANTALQQSLGLNGQTADPSNFLNMPGYQFAVGQGTQAIQRQAASMGSAYTPNTSEAIGQYVTGTAAQDYNTYISQLMGAAGLGTTANQGLQTGAQTAGNNISTLQQNIGQSNGTGVSTGANAVGGLFSPNGAGSSLIGAAAKYLGGGATGATGTNGSGVGNGGIGGTGFNSNGTSNPGGPLNYGAGGNPNGTTGAGTASDPYGANTAQYNANNPFYGTGQNFVDPNNLQPGAFGNGGLVSGTDNGIDMSGLDPTGGMDFSGGNFDFSNDFGGIDLSNLDIGSDASSFIGDF
jgi:hypothetical protein